MKEGHWVLLDEINLASHSILDRISSILDEITLSDNFNEFILLEKGEGEVVRIHKNFSIFASCNPASDYGKKSVPSEMRSKFTEIYVEDVLKKSDIQMIIGHYLIQIKKEIENQSEIKENTSYSYNYSTDKECNLLIESLTEFYLKIKAMADEFNNSSGAKPHFCIRTLVRSLQFCRQNVRKYPFLRALHDGFHANFLSPLSEESLNEAERILFEKIFGTLGYGKKGINRLLNKNYFQVKENNHMNNNFIITKSIEVFIFNYFYKIIKL